MAMRGCKCRALPTFSLNCPNSG